VVHTPKNKGKMNKLTDIYKVFLAKYGNQGWWPVTPQGKTKPEYNGSSDKKDNKAILEIIFGAILTQNTSWKNVEKALINLNKHGLVDIDKIIQIEHKDLAQYIRSSGYHNQKAERLKAISLFLKKTPPSMLSQLPPEKLREVLLTIKGIGPETADSIVLYAFNKPLFVIDTYTKRIFSRLGFCDKEIEYGQLQQMFTNRLVEDFVFDPTQLTSVFNEYHALIVEHAKRHCTTKPKCEGCVLRDICENR